MTPATTPADGVTDEQVEAALVAFNDFPCPCPGSVVRTWDADQMRAAIAAALATPSPAQAAPADGSPIGWYEAEPSCAGMNLRALLHGSGPMTHSGRMHWQAERPSTTNPAWPIYATPSPGKAEAERCWINVSDMEPTEDQKVLVYLDDGEIESATICEKFKWYAIDGCVLVAEWWMPLPAAPGAAIRPETPTAEPDESDRLFMLLAEIRAAAGDNGERMQSELVPFIAGLARDAAMFQWIIKSHENVDTLYMLALQHEGADPEGYRRDIEAQMDDAAIQQERDKQ